MSDLKTVRCPDLHGRRCHKANACILLTTLRVKTRPGGAGFAKLRLARKGVRWKRAHGDRELRQCRGPGRGFLLFILPRAQARKGSRETVMNEVPEQAGAEEEAEVRTNVQ